ncbi:Uncharacterised protein [Ralstonia pickettii]|nr:hypothetical protein HMPREF0989_02032 [Ralstonia sp. 5_2_56FAA]KFL23827.1 hypothetical protein DP23_3106 [Ralstonia pickettii]QQK36725.1 hypothetical protein RP6297_02962 [Ralstonia pickettii]SCW60533.1 hypothetical protein SAMN02799637_01631 [Ralstonia sp. UNCCL144]SUE01314.1 Uncharacterised protein [Ralstonia pickettii]
MAACAAWMSPFNAAGGEGSTCLCKSVFRGSRQPTDVSAGSRALARGGKLSGRRANCARKKNARAGEHRADGKSLRGVNSKGGVTLHRRLCRHERARRIGHPAPDMAHNIWTQTLRCEGIVGEGWAPRRNKVCRIAIECKRGKSRLVCAPIRFFGISGERLLHLHSPIVLPLRQTGLGRRRTSRACPSLGCRFDRREACTGMRCTMCCGSR